MKFLMRWPIPGVVGDAQIFRVIFLKSGPKDQSRSPSR